MAGPDAVGRVRPARHADIDRLVEIRAAVAENRLADPASVGAADYSRFLAHRGCWVWEEDGLIRGFSALDFERRSLWALFVAPEAQGRGIGRALLARAVAAARAAGVPSLSLTTAPGTRAERLYRDCGWRPDGLDDRGDIILTLDLSDEDQGSS